MTPMACWSFGKRIVSPRFQVPRHISTKVTLPLTCSETTEENWAGWCHLMTTHCVLCKTSEDWDRRRSHISTMLLGSSPSYNVMTRWATNLHCAGAFTANSWHIQSVRSPYMESITHCLNTPSPCLSEQFLGSRANVLHVLCIIISSSPVCTKRHTVKMLIDGLKFIDPWL